MERKFPVLFCFITYCIMSGTWGFSYHVTRESDPFDVMSGLFLMQCNKHGIKNGNHLVKKALIDTRQCFYENTDLQSVESNFESDFMEKLNAYMDTVCPKLEVLKNCLIGFHNATKPCLSQDEYDTSKALVDILYIFSNYSCYNNYERVKSFMAEDGPQCFQEKRTSITNCIRHSLVERYVFVDHATTDFTKPTTADVLCSNIQILKNCVMTDLKTCSKAISDDFAKNLFITLENGMDYCIKVDDNAA